MSNSILEQLKSKGTNGCKLAKELNVQRQLVYQAIEGGGSRSVRVEIACILGKKPSKIWAENDKQLLRMDDALFLLTTIEKLIAS